MDIKTITEFLIDIPTPVWIFIFIVLGIILGDKKRWEFEAKFPLKTGVGRGEVELERYKKKGVTIEVQLTLEPLYQGKVIDVYLKEQRLITIPASDTQKNNIHITEKIKLDKPVEGEEITVKINGKSTFTAPLIKD